MIPWCKSWIKSKSASGCHSCSSPLLLTLAIDFILLNIYILPAFILLQSRPQFTVLPELIRIVDQQRSWCSWTLYKVTFHDLPIKVKVVVLFNYEICNLILAFAVRQVLKLTLQLSLPKGSEAWRVSHKQLSKHRHHCSLSIPNYNKWNVSSGERPLSFQIWQVEISCLMEWNRSANWRN